MCSFICIIVIGLYVLGCLALIPTAYFLFKLICSYIRRRRNLCHQNGLQKLLRKTTEALLPSIPTKTIKRNDNELQGDGECCTICIENYAIDDVLRILPCDHTFHKNCTDQWLLDHQTCPLCKLDILRHFKLVYSNSDGIMVVVTPEATNALTNQIGSLARPKRTVFELENRRPESNEQSVQTIRIEEVQSV